MHTEEAVRVLLTYTGKFVGTLGVFGIIGALYMLISNDPLKHRFLDFVLLLVVGSCLIASGTWIIRKGKRQD